MFFRNVKKLEATTDLNHANELLESGWLLMNVLETTAHEFLFLFGLYDDDPFVGRANEAKN